MFHSPSKVVAYCKNACISTDVRLSLVLSELTDMQWDFVCFTETRAKCCDYTLSGNHRLICHHGVSYGGVGILIHAKYAEHVVCQQSFGDRVLALRLRIHHWKITVIVVYMPHAGYHAPVLDLTYDELTNATRWAYAYSRSVIVGGDFNTTLVSTSPRCQKLHEYANGFNLVISNEQDNHPIGNKWTFESSMGVRRQLDYILVGPSLVVNEAGPIDSLCLVSDHRAVRADLMCPSTFRHTSRNTVSKKHQRWQTPETIEATVSEEIKQNTPTNVAGVEQVLRDVAETLNEDAFTPFQRPNVFVFDESLKSLRKERRLCKNAERRKEISKIIQKRMRQQLRTIKTNKVVETLTSFKHISDSYVFHRLPVTKSRVWIEIPKTMGEFRESMFQSNAREVPFTLECIRNIPSICLEELQTALKQMSRGRCKDKAGICLEMIIDAGSPLQNCLAHAYNGIIRTGEMDPEWKNTFFTLLPKKGDLTNPGNWRPIAVRRVCYKIFARIIYNRIQPGLEACQSDEQMGFRRKRSTEDALLILENVIGKSLEFNTLLWFASLDLKKAFDKIEWPQLFHALDVQHVGIEYQHLLAALYSNQIGTFGKDVIFQILRGVRQGDVLSPLLFNAALDLVMSRWKSRLRNHGIKISNNIEHERLTNVRFADDLIIYSSSLEELTDMLDLLVEELQKVGLELNSSKSKIFTTDNDSSTSVTPILVETSDHFIEVVRNEDKHDYLGIKLPGVLAK